QTVVYKKQSGVTTANNVSIRTGAGTNYYVQGSLNNGANVTILGTANNFYKISYSGRTGYISAQYVKIVSKPVAVVNTSQTVVYKKQSGVTTANNVSIRTGAGTNYYVQGSLNNGANVAILGTANNFYKISYSGKTGYISAQYVKIVSKPVVVAVKQPTVVYTTQYGLTTANSLNVRSGAGTNYSTLGYMGINTNVIMLGEENNFYKILYNDKTSYISVMYVRVTAKPTTVAPVINTSTTSKTSTTKSTYNYSLDLLTSIQYGLKNALTDVTGKWLLADKTQIKYYVDPLNAQSTEQKYQFLKLNYSDGISASDINSVVQGKGVLNQKGQALLDSCKASDVNPAYLISQAFLETGYGNSNLANGIIVTQVNGKPVTPKVVYNLFGIGALDASPVRLGSEYAYNNSWFSVDQAIAGGANWISKYYINNTTNKQNTLYKMRWNPYTTGTHQYATDIGWASKQTRNIKAIMDKFSNANLYFEVPQYSLK
ncbi:SH3 domain-containing protein, partial [Clostridium algoriphilum]|uniref:SH3 domain-containing protein n=1 Tax=Clostridium algoriphilum TaxID=198347 RepID=UPI001CF155F1